MAMQRKLTVQQRGTLLREAVEVMKAEYATGLELDDVARRIATSRRQLQRCFSEQADASFRTLLTRIRMERAAHLLATTALPVRRVAASVGYSQPAQFAKAFRRHRGVAPSAFRDRCGGRGPRAAADAPPAGRRRHRPSSDFFTISP